MEKGFPEGYLGAFPSHSSTEAGKGSSGNLRDRLGRTPTRSHWPFLVPLVFSSTTGPFWLDTALDWRMQSQGDSLASNMDMTRKGEGRGCTERGKVLHPSGPSSTSLTLLRAAYADRKHSKSSVDVRNLSADWSVLHPFKASVHLFSKLKQLSGANTLISNLTGTSHHYAPAARGLLLHIQTLQYICGSGIRKLSCDVCDSMDPDFRQTLQDGFSVSWRCGLCRILELSGGSFTPDGLWAGVSEGWTQLGLSTKASAHGLGLLTAW